MLQQGGVRGEAGHDLAAAVGLKKARVQRHDMIEHRLAQVRYHPLTQPGHQVMTRVGAQRHQQGQGHQHQHGITQRRTGTGHEAAINQNPDPLANGQGDARGKYQRQPRRKENLLVRPDELPELRHHLAKTHRR